VSKAHADHRHYDDLLPKLQLRLVQMQINAMKKNDKICIVVEGRDGAGKDGLIKRITEHLSTRQTRVIALPKPSDREESQWWFQRYVAHLPACGEIVIFNRSWYNRAGVERVMKFSTKDQQEQFLRDAPEFERMLVEAGIKLVKLWLDIDKGEQKKRLGARRSDPLKQLKVSDMDKVAEAKWDDYSKARDEMLKRTHSAVAPWICVRTDDKKVARIEVMRFLVDQLAPADISADIEPTDSAVVFPFELAALTDGRLAR
jgi:polyphosphate kinase 2